MEDINIFVNRSQPPPYPSWVMGLKDPELERKGPVKFNLKTDIESYFHPHQKTGFIRGQMIYDDLKKKGILQYCFNLQDGNEIKAKGITVFRNRFGHEALPLWGSVVFGLNEKLSVPCLYGAGLNVVVTWDWLNTVWNASSPAFIFIQ